MNCLASKTCNGLDFQSQASFFASGFSGHVGLPASLGKPYYAGQDAVARKLTILGRSGKI